MDIDNWRFFPECWSRYWIAARDLVDPEEADEEADDEAVVVGSLGLPAAGEEQIAALEQRVGLVLPPSYRTFLQVSDGRRHASRSVCLPGVAERVEALVRQATFSDPSCRAHGQRVAGGPGV
ncbi:SMI1/KNR4 family protein [Streptomyces sp. NBC_00057]|uniref:SMI1/KNR4 family protein n=1 Tax=Streptomyces sp. NBC_00057 TaxID=2975634 RepID=UPI00324AF7EE